MRDKALSIYSINVLFVNIPVLISVIFTTNKLKYCVYLHHRHGL